MGHGMKRLISYSGINFMTSSVGGKGGVTSGVLHDITTKSEKAEQESQKNVTNDILIKL
jgi:hypothetical protein